MKYIWFQQKFLSYFTQTFYFFSNVKSRMEERPAELWLASESTDKGSYCLYVFPCKAFPISFMFIHPSRDGALNVFSPAPFAFSLHPIFICGTTEGKGSENVFFIHPSPEPEE